MTTGIGGGSTRVVGDQVRGMTGEDRFGADGLPCTVTKGLRLSKGFLER